jgi:hypothetical protein
MLILLASISAAGIVSPSTMASDEPETVTIRGEIHNIWPVENLRDRGLDVADIPRDRNAAWIYIEAVNTFSDLPAELTDDFDRARKDGWSQDMTDLADYLKRPENELMMNRVAHAARTRECQMPYFGNPEESVVGVMLPNLSHLRFISKMLVADARRLAHEGNYDKAFERYAATMGLAEHTALGYTLIEGLVGVAISGLAYDGLADLVIRFDLSANQLKRIEKELNRRAERLPTVERGLAGEERFGPAVVDELCSRPFNLLTNFWMFTANDDMGFLGAASNPVPRDGWARMELRIGQLIFPDRSIKKNMSGFYKKCLDRVEAGPLAYADDPFDDGAYINSEIPPWDVISRSLLPSLSRATSIGEAGKAKFALLRAVVAIRKHMASNNGKLPRSLDAIADKLPEGALSDPYGRGLVTFRQEGDGWVVYSLGPNLVDDGGEMGERWEELDISFRYPAEATDGNSEEVSDE